MDSLAPSSMEEILLTSIMSGELASVQACIASGVNVEHEYYMEKRPLLYAAEFGHLPIVEFLIDKGARVQASDEFFKNALMYAAENGHLTVVKYLLQKGCAIDLQNFRGHSALTLAIIHNHVDIVSTLLDAGADVNARSSGGEMTPLMMAAEKGYLELVKLLVQRGADVAAHNRRGYTALVIAERHRRATVVDFLSSLQTSVSPSMNRVRSSVNLAKAVQAGEFSTALDLISHSSSEASGKSVDSDAAVIAAVEGDSVDVVLALAKQKIAPGLANSKSDPLCVIAFKKKNMEMLAALLDAHVDPYAENKHGLCVSSLAAAEGNVAMLHFLVSRGIQMDAVPNKSCCYRTRKLPLHMAAMNGHLPAVEYLVDTVKVDIHAETQSKATALMLASWHGHYEVAKFLLERGSDVHHLDEDGDSALSKAALTGNLKLVQLLVQAGADVNAHNVRSGMTALIAAVQTGHADVVKLLLSNGAQAGACTLKKSRNAAYYAAKLKFYDCLVLLLASGHADLVPSNPHIVEALHGAVQNDHLRCVQALVQCGVPVDAVLSTRVTPLMTAAQHGKVEILRWLLQHGAKPNAKDYRGKTALHFACEQDSLSIVHLLVEGGADVNAQSTAMITPVFIAAEKNHPHVLKLLLENGADVTFKNEDGESAMTIAAKKRNVDVLILMVLTAEIPLQDLPGYSLVMNSFFSFLGKQRFVDKVERSDVSIEQEYLYAALTGSWYVVKALLPKVSNIDIPSPLGNNALILASAAGKYDVVKLLIDNKIDIDAQNLDGLTALHAASICGRLAVVRLLLESGCKTSLLDHRKRTAFRCAKDFQHAELVELFAAWKKTSDSRERLNEIQAQDVQDKQSSK